MSPVPPLTGSRLFQRFWSVAGAVSIRVKVLGIVMGMTVLLGLFVTIQMRNLLTATLKDQLEHQGLAIIDPVAEHAVQLIESGGLDTAEDYLRERQAHFSSSSHNTLVDYILIQDAIGNVRVETFNGSTPAALLDPALSAQRGHSDVAEIQFEGKPVLDIPAPVSGGYQARLGLAEDNIQATVNEVTVQLIYITAIMTTAGFGAAIFLTWILTRPILHLVEATQAVASGDFSRRVPRWAGDEIGDLAEAFNAMTAALGRADKERAEREQLRARYISGVILAQEDERKRIARELHDSTSQSLTSLLVGLRNLESAGDPEAVRRLSGDLRDIVSKTLEEVHNLAWQLRPSVLDDMGLQSALERYIDEQGQRTGLQIDFVMRHCDGRLPVALETSIYRVVQEALTNVIRHARATTASVLIEQRDNSVRIIVEDNGAGFDPTRTQIGGKSLGLQGIRERARLFGGTLTIESQAGQGTSLFIEMPLNAAGESPEDNRGDDHA